MLSKKFTFDTLVLLSMASFAAFGSLSHSFNLAILILIVFSFLISKNKEKVTIETTILFVALCSVFYIFVIRGFFYEDPWKSLISLSPMLPVPIIGLMILFSNDDRFKLSQGKIAHFSKVSVILAFLLYILLSNGLGEQFGFSEYIKGRLQLFSGNPIPFSTALFGVTIFCFVNWENSSFFEQFLALFCFILGLTLSGVLSETRGTLLAIIIAIPLLLLFVTRSLFYSILITLFIILIIWLLNASGITLINTAYVKRIQIGLETLFENGTSDTAMGLRLELWSASLSAIEKNPFWGYDISNRFFALKEYLPENFKKNFSHPHNDVFASTLGSGILGGVFSVICLFSPIWAALLSEDRNRTKLIFGSLTTINIISAASVNTVFFNDITAAWLAFSTFVIWNLKLSHKKSL